MSRFNNALSGGRSNGRCNGKWGGMGGAGLRLRDGSCQGLGQGSRVRQSANISGPGLFNRFFAGANFPRSTSSSVGTDELLSAIKSLQQQIDELKRQSGK